MCYKIVTGYLSQMFNDDIAWTSHDLAVKNLIRNNEKKYEDVLQ